MRAKSQHGWWSHLPKGLLPTVVLVRPGAMSKPPYLGTRQTCLPLSTNIDTPALCFCPWSPFTGGMQHLLLLLDLPWPSPVPTTMPLGLGCARTGAVGNRDLCISSWLDLGGRRGEHFHFPAPPFWVTIQMAGHPWRDKWNCCVLFCHFPGLLTGLSGCCPHATCTPVLC